VVVAGCDPVLGLLGEVVERTSANRVLAVHASTGRAVAALAAETVHGVLVHGPPGALPGPPVPIRRWQVAAWEVGLASSSEPAPVEELAERHRRVAQREPGAESQRALARALRRAGIDQPLDGPVATGHLDVARRVRAGEVDAGVTIEAAAHGFELGFEPLETHVVELWLDQRWMSTAGVAAMAEALSEPTFVRRAALLPGYDLASCGTERGAP
jgi:hypothetical protein